MTHNVLMGTLNPQRLTHCTVIVAHCLSDAPAKDSSSGFLLGRVSKVRHGLNGILLVPSAVADSRISRRIFVRRKNSAEIAAKNMFNRISTWQLQICFRIMIDVILTFDILINRLTQETQLMLTNHAPLLEVSQGHKHDTIRYVKYGFLLQCHSDFVWDIRPDLETWVRGHSKSSETTRINPPHMISY